MKTGVLSNSEGTRRLHQAASRIKYAPKCAACMFAKQKVRTPPGRKIAKVTGSEISVDHFICSTKGRLFTSRGKTAPEDMYGEVAFLWTTHPITFMLNSKNLGLVTPLLLQKSRLKIMLEIQES